MEANLTFYNQKKDQVAWAGHFFKGYDSISNGSKRVLHHPTDGVGGEDANNMFSLAYA